MVILVYFRCMILVTGGTGMLGAHLLFQLVKKGEKVRAIRRSTSSLERVKKVFGYFSDDATVLFSNIEWVTADVTNVSSLEQAFKGVKRVYHVAALVSFDEKDHKKMRAVNIGGTANVVNLCIANAVEKLCFVSSIAAVAKTVHKDLIDEEDEFNIETNNYSYAITKYGAEMEVWRGAQEGLDVAIVNPGIILGAGYWKENSGLLFSNVYKGFPFYTEGVTGFVGVNDVVQVLMKLMNSSVKNERFILVSENLSFQKVFGLIADQFGKKHPTIKVTPFLASIVWPFTLLKARLTNTSNTFTKHTATSVNNKFFYDASKLKEALGFEFETIQQVVEEVAKFYKSEISSSNMVMSSRD